ncbi:MFS transporter [Gammaproteobacteria bacterium]|jgi:MFS family permease|uniref:MFS transporter n=1 Tax=OM182 bacterium BACL3 MAG-120531-bin86 TaxID=1655628 RepID=A0A0R2XT85_9GAMM|nr:MAG: hypothetical protein ABS26_07995 [OM182 bacterium BACL3 MAG-120531-bin86]MBT3522294.1 MFS transporter [Gammaproteobacteria bacterium]MBT5906442.1 MFS transporter [Gammaproteobacteria bacterium]MBT6316980.1 MFS transporter [Gammaproteobacteria bacterium]MDB9949821.1 MFS transporter [Gammaproteobacteria bacterium]
MTNLHEQTRLEGNLRRFIAFRLLYSARFYYPVFTVLFLDYGLTLEQFAILNIVWALTIVGAEVPSGALADIVGRKRLIVFAAVLMVAEMALIAFAPIAGFDAGGHAEASPLLFWLFLGNRLCSGLSEAAASGADEALAYDSLKALGREDQWAHFLERTTRFVSVGFFVSMITGGLIYDATVVNGVLGSLDSNLSLAQTSVIRLPVIFTLVSSVVVFFIAIGFYDIDKQRLSALRETQAQDTSLLMRLARPFKQIGVAASWTLGHRFVLFVILAALMLDSVARQFVVLASEYYRVIDIPVSLFGFIGAGVSLISIANARLSRFLVTTQVPLTNFLSLSGLLLLGLFGASFAIPWIGLVFAIASFSVLGMVQFQSSYYLNRMVESDLRATVLSFRGLALNLGLGIASVFYTGLVASLRSGMPDGSEDEIFIGALPAFPLYFIGLFVLLLFAGKVFVRDSTPFKRIGGKAI